MQNQNQSVLARAIVNWEHPECVDGGRTCRTSSLLWARLLLAPSRVIFKDGTSLELQPATLESVEIAELDQPSGPDLKRTGNMLRCVVFTISSEQCDLRVRVRAYHGHDGVEFGHPGDMRHEAPDTRAWDAAYKMLLDRMNMALKTNAAAPEVSRG